MHGIDWQVSVGFEPRQRIDASKERVHALLAQNEVGLAMLHSLRGVWYDPLEGNREVFSWSGLQNFSDFNLEDWLRTDLLQHDTVTFLPVCTINPLEGEKRTKRILDEYLERGCPLWRFYPREQQWNIQHPVFELALKRLSDISACVLFTGSTEETLKIHSFTKGNLPIVADLHFYESADWCLRLGPLPLVYPTIRYFHGPGILNMATEFISEDRFLFASGTPEGSVSSVKHLFSDAADNSRSMQIWQTNSIALLRRICG